MCLFIPANVWFPWVQTMKLEATRSTARTHAWPAAFFLCFRSKDGSSVRVWDEAPAGCSSPPPGLLLPAGRCHIAGQPRSEHIILSFSAPTRICWRVFFLPSSIIGFRLAGWVCWGFSSRPALVQRLLCVVPSLWFGPLWPISALLPYSSSPSTVLECVCVCGVNEKVANDILK